MAFNWSGLGTGLGSAFNTLVSAGLPVTTAQSVLTTLMGNSAGAAEKPLLDQIVAEYQTPAVVQDLVTKALEVSNLSAIASSSLSQLPVLAAVATANPVTGLGPFMSMIGTIEKELGIS